MADGALLCCVLTLVCAHAVCVLAGLCAWCAHTGESVVRLSDPELLDGLPRWACCFPLLTVLCWAEAIFM